jgi:hypothetical protein
MYIYIDKYDYLVNNLNNDEIDEEIDSIQERLNRIGENNVLYLKRLRENITKESRGIDINSKSAKQNRLENILNQIFVLQMRQVAESISGIKKYPKNNKYLILFDTSENMKSITLDEPSYKNVLRYRDAMNSVSVYDLFQEKIHYYLYIRAINFSNNNNIAQSKSNKTDQKKNTKQKKPSNDQIQIAQKVNINYEFCHHCKQRKPAEMMLKCTSDGCNKILLDKPLKYFFVNNTTVAKSKIVGNI